MDFVSDTKIVIGDSVLICDNIGPLESVYTIQKGSTKDKLIVESNYGENYSFEHDKDSGAYITNIDGADYFLYFIGKMPYQFVNGKAYFCG